MKYVSHYCDKLLPLNISYILNAIPNTIILLLVPNTNSIIVIELCNIVDNYLIIR